MSRIRRTRRRRAFTLVELLVVIGIIAVLIGILIPVVAKMRTKAYEADTKNFISQLGSAIERYHDDFKAYPGPLSNNEIRNDGSKAAQYPQMGSSFPGNFAVAPTATAAGFDNGGNATNVIPKVTMAENLVLGLLGGLRVDTTTAQPVLQYDPALVGNGASSLNTANPKKYNVYLEGATNRLSWRTEGGLKTGRYMDGTNFNIDDTIIPELTDPFPDSMPILYLRAKPGVKVVPVGPGINETNNSVITNDPTFNAAPVGRPGSYDLTQIIAYTACYNGGTIEGQPAAANTPPSGAQTLGVGKTVPTYYNGSATAAPTPAAPYHGLRTVYTGATATPGNGYYYPLDGYAYFENPAIKNTARSKDSYILISAGVDRMYGTTDDVVSFGSVGQ